MRIALLASSAIVAVALTSPAVAQDTASASGTTAATDAADSNNTADIVVTAQKRTEKLQDIPVAAAVLSADAVAQNHVTDLSDINRVVPSVQIKGTFNGRVPYGVRGISTNANEGAIGLTSGVSLQVDGVPVPADSFAANTISDVAQLEVLKGPQSTLGGRTASAGVINFVTYSPTRDPRFGFNATVTDDGEYRVDAHASGPIVDGVSYSLAGYDSHTPYPVYNIAKGERSKANSYGIRGKLKFEIGSDFDMTVMGHYALSTSTGGTFVPIYLTPGANIFPFIPTAFNAMGVPTQFGIPQSIAFPNIKFGYGNGSYESPVNMSSRYDDLDGTVNLNYHAGPLTFSSLTSLFRENQFQLQDVFLTRDFFFNDISAAIGNPFPPFGDFQSSQGRVNQFTQEFKLASDPSQPINFLAGAYYSNMKVFQHAFRGWIVNDLAKDNTSTTKNYAAYLRVTAKLSDMISVTGGVRYDHDKIGWNIAQFFNPAAQQYEGCLFNPQTGAGAFGCTHSYTDSSNSFVGDLALQAHINRDTMVYASYSHGYKPRAFNTAHDFASLQSATSAADLGFTTPTRKEQIDGFEVGLKSSLLDRHVTFNLAAFYTNYKDYQAQIFNNAGLVGVLVLANAGARTAGVEADLNYVKDNTRFSISAAYIDAKFKNFAGAVCYPGQSVAQGCVNGAQNLTGVSLPDSPKFKMNASVQQTIPLDPINVILGGNFAYRSATLFQADQNPQTRQPGFGLLDLSIGFQTKDEKETLTFFVNNVTNHFHYSNMEDFFSGATGFPPAGGGNYVVGQPARDARRYFGGRIAVKF